MHGNDLDINHIISKSSSKDRITIFFDQMLRMSILHQSKFTNEQLEMISQSIKNVSDIDLFNSTMKKSLFTLLIFAEVENDILKIESMITHLLRYIDTQDDKFMIEKTLSYQLNELLKSKVVNDSKKLKKTFKTIKEDIERLSPSFILEREMNKVVEAVYPDEKIDKESCDEKMTEFLRKAVRNKIRSADLNLEIFGKNYEEFEIKFEVVEEKVKELEGDLERFRKFANLKN